MDDLLDDFLDETNENLDALSNDLVAWEKAPADRSLLDGIFRFFHTIKGNSGFLEFERLGRLSHAAETTLARARDGGVVPDAWFVSTIFAAIDEIRGILEGLSETRAEPGGDDGELIVRLEQAATGDRPATSCPDYADSPSDVAAAEGAGGASRAQAASVRVPVGLLDRLMGIASELVLARNALLRSIRQGEEVPANLIEHVSACVTDLQDGINRTRMQPMEALWTPLPRLVRDLAHELGKELDLTLEGGDTEIDRQLLEAIRDPIGHMVRNSADHGIESPEERHRLGKRAAGSIRISARQSGGHIYLELSDDGRGIDPARLRARAVAMGLMNAAEADHMSDAAAQALIFEPGLSTATAITAISGRGVGMDVVRSNLERIGGSVEVRSRLGQGTTFIIRVPLTLTIVPALIVGVGGMSYAIGQASIREIVRLKADAPLPVIGGRRMIELRDVLIPAVDLGEMFGSASPAGERWGVIVEIGGIGRVALMVDIVHDQEEIVIKPVSPLIGAAGIYSGATVLGSGEAALVLDLPAIAALLEVAAGAPSAEAKSPETAKAEAPSWMLVEAGGTTPKAIPLMLVARIENLDPEAVSQAGGRPVMQHDGQLVPFRTLPGKEQATAAGLVLILDDGHRRAALGVDRVADVVACAMTIEQPADGAGLAGVALVDGRPVEVVDTGWLMGEAVAPRVRGSILVIGNRQFASGVLKPLLESAGHDAMIVSDEAEAAALAARGVVFDLVLSEGEHSAQGLGTRVLRLGTDATAPDALNPYDQTSLLRAVDGSLRRAVGEAA